MKIGLRVSFGLALIVSVLSIATFAALNIASGSIYSLPAETFYGAGICASGVLPITLFYLSLASRIRLNSNMPSDTEIDSTYYLGFLITLTTLIVTVFSTALSILHRSDNVVPLGDQSTLVSVSFAFALSLLVTALALFYRISLASMKERSLVDLSIAGLEDHVSNMVLQIDLSYSKLTSTIDRAIIDLEASSSQKNSQFASELKVVTTTIQDELRGFMAGLAAEMNSTGLSESIRGVTESFRHGGAELNEIINSLGPIPDKITAITSTLDDVGSTTSALGQEVSSVLASVGGMETSLGGVPIESVGQRVTELTAHLDSLSAAIERSESTISSGASFSSGLFETTTRQLEEASKILGNAFTALSGELAKTAGIVESGLTQPLSGATQAFRRGAEDAGALFELLGPVSERIAGLSKKLEEAANETSVLNNNVGNVQSSLRSAGAVFESIHIETVGAAANQLTSRLDTLGEALLRSENVISSGAAMSSEALAKTTVQLTDASGSLGSAFVTLSAELAKTADLLARELK